MANHKLNVVIVGGGNAAHCFIGMIRRQKKIELGSLLLFSTLEVEEKAWSACKSIEMTLPTGDVMKDISIDGVIPNSNPGPLLKAADVFLICVPSFAIEPVLSKLLPHVREGATLISMPGNGGFTRCVRHHLGDRDVIVVGTQQLPIQARLTEYAKACRLLGTKHGIQFAAEEAGNPCSGEKLAELRQLMENLFDPVVFHILKGGPDGLDVYASNQCIHIPRLFGLAKNQPFNSNPFFYEGYQDEEIEHMNEMCDELRKVSEVLGSPYPCMKEVMVRYYHHSIEDQSTLKTCFTSNKGYEGLLSPMVQREDGLWVLDLSSRYFIEDIPYSLLVGKAIAVKYGVETPVVDKIIRWAEKLLDTKYFVSEDSNQLDPNAPAVQNSLVRYYL